jgi:hypothetical protein
MADRLLEEVSRVLSVTGGTDETIILSRVPDYIIVDVIGGDGFEPIRNERILQGGTLQLGDPTGTGLFMGAISFDGNVVDCGYYSNGAHSPTLTVKAYIGPVMVDDITLSNIADAIRGKNGTDEKYLPSEMAGAIEAISAGGGANEVVDFIPQTETKTVTIPYTKSGKPNFICVYTKDSTSLRASGQRLIWQGAGYADDGTILYGGYAVALESTGEMDHWNRDIEYSIDGGTITITVVKHMLAGVLYKIIVY